MKRDNNKNKNKNKNKTHHTSNKKSSQSAPHPNRKLNITFDVQKRKEYLSTFSKRKAERRCYGLAIQKVKDRKLKLQARKIRRNDAKEKEKEYIDTYKSLGVGSDNDDDDDDDGDNNDEEEEVEDVEEEMAIGGNTTNKKQKINKSTEDDDDEEMKEKKDNKTSKKRNTSTTSFQDEITKNQFGGAVCVTTTMGFPEDSDDEELRDYENEMSKKKNIDREQRSYNSVDYYLKGVKETCNSKKKDAKGHKGLYNKGKYGGSNMPGIAKGKDFKIVSMALRKANAGRDFSSVNTGGGKRGKGRQGKKK